MSIPRMEVVRHDAQQVKDYIRGRWAEELAANGIDPDFLSGNHCPCPKCGGTDRWRFTDLNGDGGAICNQCGKFGDGFAVLEWFTGKKFVEVLTTAADRLGIQPVKSGRNKKTAAKPDEHLTFEPWDPGNDMLAAAWCIWKEPINVAAIKAVGGRIARYRGQYLVLALPVWGKLLDTAAPVGWVIYNLAGGNLPKYAKNSATGKWEISEWVKVKLTAGSAQGVITDLSRLTAARVVVKVEGGTDLLTLLSLADLPVDVAVLTTANGAGEKPRPWMLELLHREEAIICHDMDKPGQAGVSGWVDPLAPSVPTKNILLPFAMAETHGQDLRDYFQPSSGHTFEHFQQLAAATMQAEVNSQVGKSAADRPESLIYNAIEQYEEGEDGSEKKVIEPLTMAEVKELIGKATNNFPRRTGNALFIHCPTHGIGWLDAPSAMFGWLAEVAGVIDWHKARGCVSREEVFHEFRRSAQNYAAVENLPHEPLLPNHYYACADVAAGDGKYLGIFLDRFNPETDIDRDLIQAFLMTPLWGGQGGMRPVFVVTTADGTGSGKTTLVRIFGQLFGGLMSFDRGEQVKEIKTRLLSADALTKRLGLIDNVKTQKWSWGEFEGLITSPVISGHRMFMGEGSRPNTLTWAMTLNGANLSNDMAQRAVIIRLSKPTTSGSWEDDTRRFIEEHRASLIADLIGALRIEPHRFAKFTRWADWESAVLARVPNPVVAQQAIADRQGAVDADLEENETLEDYYGSELRSLGYDIRTDRIFIPSKISSNWFNRATGERFSPTAVTRHLRKLIGEKKLTCLIENKDNRNGRGIIWAGVASYGLNVFVDLTKRIAARLAKLREQNKASVVSEEEQESDF